MKILSLFGTRPEAIKFAPIIQELNAQGIDNIVCSTGQHRQMLDQVLSVFDITPDVDLNIMKESQTLDDIASSIFQSLGPVLDREKPDVVLVQGDTSTALIAAMVSFYRKIPVGHVEAGLRSHDKFNPFPEEMNRVLIGRLADHHFAPTKLAAEKLAHEGVNEKDIYLTGNTVIDALQWVVKNRPDPTSEQLAKFKGGKNILITAHRRENLGDGMENIFSAVAEIASAHPEFSFVFPVHLNPVVGEHANKVLGNIDNVHLIAPLDYADLAWMLNESYFVMTDSGGIQEEAPALGKPVIVLRETTERTEGVDAGTALLIGTDKERIVEYAEKLISDQEFYTQMANAVNPYGDGTAAKQIVDVLKTLYV